MKPKVIPIDATLHTDLKVYCAKNSLTIKDVVEQAIREIVYESERKETQFSLQNDKSEER